MAKSTSPYYIGLVDCNNFFVSCERLFRPDLQGKPVIVLSSNDGCVVARSQEVKDMGIPMGVPLFHIKDIIKDKQIITFSSNFTLYRDISYRVFSVVKSVCTDFEQYSIDEGFFRVPHSEAEALGWRIKDTIARTLGMPVSVGLAPSKTLAKYASARAKCDSGVRLLSRADWEVCAPSVGLGELWGVGTQRTLAFAQIGLKTAAEYMAADPALVQQHFGVEGTRLQLELLGVSAYHVITTSKQQQSITHSQSFKRPTQQLSVVQDAVAYHVRRGVDDLEDKGLYAQFIKVFIRSSRYESRHPGWGSEMIELKPATSNLFTLMTLVQQAVEQLYQPGIAYQKAGVILGGLRPIAAVTPSLLPENSVVDTAKIPVLKAVRSLNQRWGQDLVRLGVYTGATLWQSRRDVLSPAYTTRWSDLRVVR